MCFLVFAQLLSLKQSILQSPITSIFPASAWSRKSLPAMKGGEIKRCKFQLSADPGDSEHCHGETQGYTENHLNLFRAPQTPWPRWAACWQRPPLSQVQLWWHPEDWTTTGPSTELGRPGQIFPATDRVVVFAWWIQCQHKPPWAYLAPLLPSWVLCWQRKALQCGDAHRPTREECSKPSPGIMRASGWHKA